MNNHSIMTSEFKFVTTAREGATLVLPNGASREDLRSTTHLTKYIEKYALSWHYFAFHNAAYSGGALPNGSLYLVTGCDRAKSYSLVAIPVTTSKAGDRVEMTFKKDDWTDKNFAGTNTSWDRKRVSDGTERETCAFPQADVAIVHDSVWCNVVDSKNGDGTAKTIFKFIVALVYGDDAGSKSEPSFFEGQKGLQVGDKEGQKDSTVMLSYQSISLCISSSATST
ncbi:hypothetical protein CPC08DRAFT_766335 [Agrocybe pediades]|nr:hypothetical protein CPC08DRAFT_766335 [Agrocybe pediades]